MGTVAVVPIPDGLPPALERLAAAIDPVATELEVSRDERGHHLVAACKGVALRLEQIDPEGELHRTCQRDGVVVRTTTSHGITVLEADATATTPAKRSDHSLPDGAAADGVVTAPAKRSDRSPSDGPTADGVAPSSGDPRPGLPTASSTSDPSQL